MPKKMDMYRILSLILALAVVILSLWSLVYPDENHSPYKLAQFFLGLMFLFTGFSELKANRKTYAIVCFSVSLFSILVFITTLLFRKG
ncbi:putative membrane protein [Paenibacillus sp. RC73]